MSLSWIHCSSRVTCLLVTLTIFAVRGGDAYKILKHSGETIPVVFYNNASVVLLLPCLTESHEEHETLEFIMLFKGTPATHLEVISRNDSRIIEYTQFRGFLFNASGDSVSAGTNYTCAYRNVAETNDFVIMTLTGFDDFVNVTNLDLNSKHDKIYVTNYNMGRFLCQVDGDSFDDSFTWSLKTKDGQANPVDNATPENSKTESFLESRISLQFPSSDITGVLCNAKKKGSEEWATGASSVTVQDPQEPRVLDKTDLPIPYEPGLQLICSFVGYPIYTGAAWVKDGHEINNLNSHDDLASDIKKSFYQVEPTDEDRNNYTCVVKNQWGSDSASFIVTKEVPDSLPLWFVLTLVVGAVALSIALILLAVCIVRLVKEIKRRRRLLDSLIQPNEASKSKLEETTTTYENQVKLSTSDYKSAEFVGKGHYGEIFRVVGTHSASNSRGWVAFKVFKWPVQITEKQAELMFEDFKTEIQIMQRLTHGNIVSYLGVDSPSEFRFKVHLVMEYCCAGQLERFLQYHRDAFENDIVDMDDGNSTYIYNEQNPLDIPQPTPDILRTSHLMKWSEQIASAMEYVSSLGIIHRDLAARNILLTHTSDGSIDSIVALLSDFGLARDISVVGAYTMQADTTAAPAAQNPDEVKPRGLPSMWYSPEALEDTGYSSASDVWSFGCLLWEIFTLAQRFPYQDLLPDCDYSAQPQLILQTLVGIQKEGKRPVIPEDAVVDVPFEIQDLMLRCWSESQESRPTFTKIHKELVDINREIYRIYNSFYKEVQQICDADSEAVVQLGTPKSGKEELPRCNARNASTAEVCIYKNLRQDEMP